jgi:predicted alpha/beta hydrolase
MSEARKSPAPLTLQAPDGYELRGFAWRHDPPGDPARPVVIINAATSVRCEYYARFAAFLHHHGFDVITYDYRGIGNSRPTRLRGFVVGWLDWGQLDFEAVLQHVAARYPGQPVQVVGHSIGGFLIGLAPSNERIQRVFTVGAQFAYWRDYLRQRRLGMLLKWHLAMPLLTRVLGYFPGKRLGWMEDTPKGVVRDWVARHPRFEDAYRSGTHGLDAAQRQALVERFAAMRGATLALSLDDDEFGTVAAVQRLLRYFRNSRTIHLHIAPASIGVPRVGHFAFFHGSFESALWHIALEWLRTGRLASDARRHVVEPAPQSGRSH